MPVLHQRVTGPTCQCSMLTYFSQPAAASLVLILPEQKKVRVERRSGSWRSADLEGRSPSRSRRCRLCSHAKIYVEF